MAKIIFRSKEEYTNNHEVGKNTVAWSKLIERIADAIFEQSGIL